MVHVPAHAQDKLRRDTLALRLRALAVQHSKIASALMRDEQAMLRKTFLDSAEAMLDAARELSPLPAPRGRL